jgi:hypothetical protein
MAGAAITGKDLQRIHEHLEALEVALGKLGIEKGPDGSHPMDHVVGVTDILDASDDLDSELDRRFEDGQEAGEVSGSERTWEEVCGSLKGGWMGFSRNSEELMFEEIASIVSNVRHSFERKEALKRIGAVFTEVIG